MASKNISFDQIPASIRKPGKYFEFNTRLAVRTLPANLQRVLIVGQKTSSGTVAQLIPTRVYSSQDAAVYFGRGSMAHRMAIAAITAYPYLDLSICALDDAATGVPATLTVTIANAATGSGSLKLYIGADVVEIGIADEDTAAEIAAALKAEIDNHPDLAIVATVNAAIVTLTALNDGLCGSQIDVSASVTAASVTATVAVGTAGSVDPDVEDALKTVAAESFDIIITPYNNQTALGSLTDHLDLVSGPLEQRPGIGVYGYDGVIADAEVISIALNHGRLLCAYLRGTKSPQYEVAAAMGAVMASEEDPARPLNTLELKGINAPPIEQRLSRTEQEGLLHSGITPLEVGPGENVQIVRAISTYTEDAQGIADVSLLDITTIRTLDYVRKACRERIALRFPREKLSSKTPAKVKSQLLDVLLKLEELEIVEAVMENKDALIVERDEQDANRLNAKIPADIVNGLHVFAGRIDLML